MDFTKKRHKMWKPLEGRTYRYKNSAMEFFCPLCRTKRNISMSFRLSVMNYVQIALVTALFTGATYSLWEFRGSLIFFILWPAFEFVRRSLFKKDIPCPHCGFDASWYKKDVKVARKLVSDFWQEDQSSEGELPMPPVGDSAQNRSENSAQF